MARFSSGEKEQHNVSRDRCFGLVLGGFPVETFEVKGRFGFLSNSLFFSFFDIFILLVNIEVNNHKVVISNWTVV